MKISLNWIEEILNAKLNCSVEELSEKLLALGFEVSSYQSYPECNGVVVAEILEIEKHPNADRLQLAKVTDGKESETVVCGAPNIAKGQKVFWAKVGAQMADGQSVKKSSIRGVSSPGMLCSAKELGVGEDHAGIWILNEELPPGKSLQEFVLLKDTILDIEVTPNRPDCLSHIGMAREIALALNLPFPKTGQKRQVSEGLPEFPVAIENPEDCLRYIARKLEGIRVAPSPLAVQVRLLRCGIRPINNVVDMTNLTMLECGQPLHAFDLEQLQGEKIVVRRAKIGEKILALDGKNYDLNPEILVIADARKPQAIAGVMGGEESAVTENTKKILLESAVFEKRRVRRARKILNLSTESAYRFERGVTHWSCTQGSLMAERMLCQISGGKTTAIADVPSLDPKPATVVVRMAAVSKNLGDKISQSETISLLERLGTGLVAKDEERISVQNPPWRTDLNLEIDFIEEIARLRNYEKIPSSELRIRIPAAAETDNSLATAPMQKAPSSGMGMNASWESSITGKTLPLGAGLFTLKKELQTILRSLGFSEAVNYGLISKKMADAFLPEEFQIFLENPLSEEQDVLRPSLLPELLKNLKLNLSYQKKEIRLFEIGRVFQKIKSTPDERTFLAGAATGPMVPSHWKNKQSEPVNFFWLKGAVEKIFSELKIPKWKIVHPVRDYRINYSFSMNSSSENSQSMNISNGVKIGESSLPESFSSQLRNSNIFHPATLLQVLIEVKQSWQIGGTLGMLHPALAKTFELQTETALFELNLSLLQQAMGKRNGKVSLVLRTPIIQRDCSIWIPQTVLWQDVESEIRKTAGTTLSGIELFDLYSDPKQPEVKSLSFTLTFQHPEKTLSDEAANELRDAVIAALHKKFKAKLRERSNK